MKKLLLSFGFLSIFIFNFGVLTQNAEAQVANNCLSTTLDIYNVTFVNNTCALPVGYAVCLKRSPFVYVGCEDSFTSPGYLPAYGRNIMVTGLSNPYIYHVFACLNRLPVNVIWNGYGLVGQC